MKRQFDWSVLRSGSGQAEPAAAASDSSPAEGRLDAEGDGERAQVVRPDSTAGERGQTASIGLRVNDLKQYAYCERIVFYQYAMPVQRKSTFKMEHGKLSEEQIQRLEQRRRLREYGLAEGARHFQVWLESPRLGLSGRLDLLIITPRHAFPVDFKETLGPVRENHRIQLCAYALLVEEAMQRSVPCGFIYRIPREDVLKVDIIAELRAHTERLIEEIRRMIETERMPPPTSVRARCVDCEYRNYCGDVF